MPRSTAESCRVANSWIPNAWPLPVYRLDRSQPMSFTYRLSPMSEYVTRNTEERS